MPRVPAFTAALAFAGGVLMAHALWRPVAWWLAALSVAAVAAAIWMRRSPRWALAMALAAVAALGAMAAGLNAESWAAERRGAALEAWASGEEVLVTAHVVRDGVVHERGGEVRQAVDVETEEIQPLGAAGEGARGSTDSGQGGRSPGEAPGPTKDINFKNANSATTEQMLAGATNANSVRGGIRLTVYGAGDDEDAGEGARTTSEPPTARRATSQFVYGERIRFRAKLRGPRNFGNPGAWDYAGYLAGQGISALASARADRVETLPGFAGSRWGQWRSAARRSVLARTAALWDSPRAALINAMVIGDKAQISREERVAFQRSGVFHILVVSGMNVGILAFVVFWVLRRLRVSEVAGAAVTVALAIGYTYLTDAGAPIMRATLMLAIYLGARLVYRERSPLNAVGIAGLGLLAIEPRALFDASFQLTFLSVAAIGGMAVPLLERTSEPYRRALRYLDSPAYDLTLAPRLAQFRLDLRMIIERLAMLVGRRAARWSLLGVIGGAVYVYDLIVVSFLTQLALALPMAVYFHRAVTVGLPANVLVVPATAVLMPAAVAAVALAYVSPWLAKPAALLTAWSLQWITRSVDLFGGWRAADWRVPKPSLTLSVCAVAAIVLCLLTARRRRALAWAALGALAGTAVWIAIVPPRPQVRPGVLEITAIDVADSTLLVTPQGKAVLLDAAGSLGPWQSEFDFGEDVISPYLWARGFSRLDAVALTHAHSDHLGGMAAVVANFRPRELWLGPTVKTAALESLLQQARAQGVRIVARAGGDDFGFGGARFQVLSPPGDWQLAAKVRNNDSLVLRVGYGNTAVLLSGDAEKKMEPGMIAEGAQAALLKVAHNGSATSTTPELLAAVHPGAAVISVGQRNPFRHPRPEVLLRLQKAGVATYRTDTLGALSFYLDGEKVTPLPDRNPR